MSLNNTPLSGGRVGPSPAEGHLACLQALSLMSQAALHLVQVCVWTCVFHSGSMPRHPMAGCYSRSRFSPCEKPPTRAQVAAPPALPPAASEVPAAPHPGRPWLLSGSGFGPSDGSPWPPWGSTCIFRRARCGEGWRVLCVSSGAVSLRAFGHFRCFVFVFLLLNFKVSL